jgi:hypothetical protein
VNDTDDRDERREPSLRHAYCKPRLKHYGHVKDIVQGGGGTKSDASAGAGHGATRSCWIAAALYGEEAAQTILLRSWLARIHDDRRPAWPLVRLYGAWGPTVALWIHRGYIPSAVFRPLFDALFARANDETARRLGTTAAVSGARGQGAHGIAKR